MKNKGHKNHSGSFKPVLLMCCSLCSSGIGLWHCTKQTDGADQSFSCFLLRTEEMWQKSEPGCRWWRALCVGFLCIWIHHTCQAQLSSHRNAITDLKLSIFKLLSAKIYHKERQNILQVPFDGVLYLSSLLIFTHLFCKWEQHMRTCIFLNKHCSKDANFYIISKGISSHPNCGLSAHVQ